MLSYLHQRDSQIPKRVISEGLLKIIEEVDSHLEDEFHSVEKYMEIETLTFSLKKFGDFAIILVDDYIEDKWKLIQELGWRFLRSFGNFDLFDWKGETDKFASFIPIIQNLMDDKVSPDEVTTKMKRLTPVDIFDLTMNLQPTALAILAMENASIEEIARELDCDLSEAEENLEILRNQGFLSRMEDGETIHYKTASL